MLNCQSSCNNIDMIDGFVNDNDVATVNCLDWNLAEW